MRDLVLNLAVGPDLHAAEHPFAEAQISDLTHMGLLTTALRYLSAPSCPVVEPRLRTATAGWHDISQALRQRQREDRAAGGPANDPRARSDGQALIDRALLILVGRPDQVQRFDAQLLPSSELTAVVRGRAFEPLQDFRRRRDIQAADISHAHDCIAARNAPGLYRSEPARELEADEFRALLQIEKRIDIMRGVTLAGRQVDEVTYEVKLHVGWCPLCRHKETVAHAVHVVVRWNGWTVARDYEL